jgi:hypothetical protein
MSIEQEIIQVLSQLPGAIEKALLDVLVLRHPGHPNQKVHGNRFGGFETTKESARGKRSPYHKDIVGGQGIFNRLKQGGAAKLRSHDNKLDVDVSIKTFGGAYGLAVKRPGDKNFGKHRMMSSNDIANYLAQFKGRK